MTAVLFDKQFTILNLSTPPLRSSRYVAKMKITYSTFIIVILLCGNLFAAQVRPPVVNDRIAVPATLSKDPVQQIHIGDFVAKFEETTLGEIREAIGHGAIDHFGDASESQYWLCYTLPQQRIWLISHGEMGGSDHTLTQISAVSFDSTVGEKASCPSLNASEWSVNFDFGWLGSSRNTIIQNLGEPSGTSENSLTYFYSGKQPGPYQDRIVDLDVIGYLEMNLKNGKVTTINASHVTSY